jgi:hypothetical protein
MLHPAGGRWGDSFAYKTLNGQPLGMFSKKVKPDGVSLLLGPRSRVPKWTVRCTFWLFRALMSADRDLGFQPQGRTPLFNCTSGGAFQRRRLASHRSSAAPATDRGNLGSDGSATTSSGGDALLQQRGSGGRGLTAQRGPSAWFLSAHRGCEGFGSRPRLIGYVSTWKVGDARR